MRSRLRVGVVVAGVAFGAAAGCNDVAKSCTLVGCQDQFSITVQRADGSLPAGTHVVSVAVLGASFSCTFVLPLATVAGGAQQPACPGFTVTVWPAETCTTTSAGSTCDPIAGQFVETITLPGTPTQVHLQQSVDGASVADVILTPSYMSVAPNGSECGPICHQATASVTLN